MICKIRLLAIALGLSLIQILSEARAAEYQVAKVLWLGEGSVGKSQFTGEPFGQVHFVTSRPYTARAQELKVQVGGIQYTLRREVRSKSDLLRDLQAGDRVEVRIDESRGRAFLKRPEGKEWKADLLTERRPASCN